MDSFNNFFVGVGPKLANKIVERDAEGSCSLLMDRNLNSMFLSPTDETELIDIVGNCNNKTSTDSNEIDMTIVKKVIEGIVKPLTHICNLSFQTGKFPSSMKIAKVIPIFKIGDKHFFFYKL